LTDNKYKGQKIGQKGKQWSTKQYTENWPYFTWRYPWKQVI